MSDTSVPSTSLPSASRGPNRFPRVTPLRGRQQPGEPAPDDLPAHLCVRLGAAGAVETIFCIKAINEGVVPPTLNLEDPSDGLPAIDLVAHEAQERKINVALSNSFGFGGTNASVIVKAFDGERTKRRPLTGPLHTANRLAILRGAWEYCSIGVMEKE